MASERLEERRRRPRLALAAGISAALTLAVASCGLEKGLASDVTWHAPAPPVVPVLCPSTLPFGPPVLVDGLGPGTDTVRFMPDERVAFLGRKQPGHSVDIFTASRSELGMPLGTPEPLSSLDSLSEDNNPSVTADGLTLYMDSMRSGQYQLFMATRQRADQAFGAPVELSALDVYGEGNPYVTPDGAALYFHSYRSGNADLYRVAKTADGFGPALRLGTICTGGTEYAPVVSPDELTLYYYGETSDPRTDGVLWMATRTSTADDFSSPSPLATLTLPGSLRPEPTWISPDGCRLYFKSSDISTGNIRTFVAARNPP